VIDLYRDGTLIAIERMDRNSLAWSDTSDRRIHNLALIEFVTNFAPFYKLVLDDFQSKPKQIEFKLDLENMNFGGDRTSLGPWPVGSYGFQFGDDLKDAPGNEWSASLKAESGAYSPARIALLIVREVFIWFGHSEESIPYTDGDVNAKTIDLEAIFSIR
jgi:hypothetical protein